MRLHVWFALLTSATALLAAPMTTLVDFTEQRPQVKLHRATLHNQKATYQNLENITSVLRIDWTQTKASYFEFALSHETLKKTTLPDFTKLELQLRAFIPPNSSLRYVNLRLQDKFGEVFQYRSPIAPDQQGWQTLVYKVDANSPSPSSWGGNRNGQPKVLELPARFLGMAADYRKAKNDDAQNWIAVRDLKFRVTQFLKPVRVTLNTTHPIRVLTPETPREFPLITLHNPGDETQSISFAFTLTDAWKNTHARQNCNLKLNPGQTSTLPLPRPETFGVYYVNYVLKDQNKHLPQQEGTLRFARFNPVGQTTGRGRGFIFGVCGHPQRYPRELQEKEAVAAATIGAKVLREDVNWATFQSKNGDWTPESFDFCVDVFAKYGIDIQAIYSYCPSWAKAKDWKPLVPHKRGSPRPDYALWRNFIREFARRYRHKVHLVEVWNEPDLLGFANFTVEEYVQLMKIAYEETKRNAPEMTVLTAGYATVPPCRSLVNPNHMATMLTAGRGAYDVHAFHGHGPYTSFRKLVGRLLAIRQKLKVTEPWYANETAVTSANIPELKQAEILVQKFVFAWANGAIGYNWYDLRNDGFKPTYGEHNYGLITHDFYPKPAYVTYNTLATLLTQATFLRKLDLEGQLEAFAFITPQENMVIPHWNLDANQNSHVILLTGINGKPKLVDLFGNETPVNRHHDAIVLTVGTTPAFLVIERQKDIPRQGKFIAIETAQNNADYHHASKTFKHRMQELAALPGQPQRLKLNITNPTAADLKATITLETPTCITADKPSQNATLKPGKTQAFNVILTPDKTVENLHRPPVIKVTTALGKLWKGQFQLPVNPIRHFPTPNGQPLFTLNRKEQNVKLAPEAPDLQHLTWNGPEDCSANIFLDARDQNLILRVVVTDDTHQQTFTGFNLWQGDSVQLAMDLGKDSLIELGLARKQDGTPETFVFSAPKGFNPIIKLKTARDDNAKTTTYHATIPFDSIGMTEKIARRGFLFNLLVNDSDQNLREGYMAIAPGIGLEKSSRAFPIVRLREKDN